jgi:hypothetical protein
VEIQELKSHGKSSFLNPKSGPKKEKQHKPQMLSKMKTGLFFSNSTSLLKMPGSGGKVFAAGNTKPDVKKIQGIKAKLTELVSDSEAIKEADVCNEVR